jgi:hypothetical protein
LAERLAAAPARAEPRAVELSRFEARVTDVEPVLGERGALEASVAPAGDPQTSQYPSMMLPVQPGIRQRPVGTLATGA